MSADEVAPELSGSIASEDADLTWWRVLGEPAVVAILLATVAHIARRNATDIVVFLGTTGVIAVDRIAPLGDGRRAPLPRVRARLLAAVMIGYALLMLPAVRGGTIMRVLLALPGLTALAVLLRNSAPPRQPRTPGRGWTIWPAILVFGCLFELANFLMQTDPMTPNHAHPVLSDIVEPWLATGVARAVFSLLWLLVGWHLLRLMIGSSEEER